MISQVSDETPIRRLPGMKITNESHLDHGLTEAHIAWLLKLFSGRDAFFIETINVPLDLPSLPCALHGPTLGDMPIPDSECSYAVRGDRPGKSRMCARVMRQTRKLTVIAGPHGDDPCILYTAFGGPSTPREPFDPSLDDAGRSESEGFWSEHALSWEES